MVWSLWGHQPKWGKGLKTAAFVGLRDQHSGIPRIVWIAGLLWPANDLFRSIRCVTSLLSWIKSSRSTPCTAPFPLLRITWSKTEKERKDGTFIFRADSFACHEVSVFILDPFPWSFITLLRDQTHVVFITHMLYILYYLVVTFPHQYARHVLDKPGVWVPWRIPWGSKALPFLRLQKSDFPVTKKNQKETCSVIEGRRGSVLESTSSCVISLTDAYITNVKKKVQQCSWTTSKCWNFSLANIKWVTSKWSNIKNIYVNILLNPHNKSFIIFLFYQFVWITVGHLFVLTTIKSALLHVNKLIWNHRNSNKPDLTFKLTDLWAST